MRLIRPPKITILIPILLSTLCLLILGAFLPQQISERLATLDSLPEVTVLPSEMPVTGEALPVQGERSPEQPQGTQPTDAPAGEGDFDFPYDPEKPCLVLTFDDGPSQEQTPLLLEALDARGVKASFFVLGKNAERYQDTIAAAFSAGHDICSHGYDHQSKLTQLSQAEIDTQLDQTAQVIREITGSDPLYLRPPYGAIDRATAAKIPVPMMLWTIDPRDWESRDAAQVRDKILEDAFDGGVVICHDIYPSTVQGVVEAVDLLLEQGWQFLSLSQYYQVMGIEPQAGQVYRGTGLAQLD